MPEGDTILRAARTLQKAIGGRVVTGWSSPLPALREAGITGRSVERVEAQGKNLLIHFNDGRTLHTHMRMTGSWHIYRPGEPWQKPASYARVVLETDAYVAVCFSAPVVELMHAARAVTALKHLGPDVLDDGFDADEALRRIRELDRREIGEAIMNQHVLAGIGNIYKSETLFVCHADPFAPVASFSDEELHAVMRKARELMRENLDSGPRRTRPGGEPYWVYRRSGQACLVCGEVIRMRRQGLGGRSTYFCPRCQPGARDAVGPGGTFR